MDSRAYIDAVKAYADIVYRTALSYTKVSQDAEDVTQTVFMKLLEAKDEFEGCFLLLHIFKYIRVLWLL